MEKEMKFHEWKLPFVLAAWTEKKTLFLSYLIDIRKTEQFRNASYPHQPCTSQSLFLIETLNQRMQL